MRTNPPVVSKLPSKQTGRTGGMSATTFAGLAATLLFLATMACSTWWAFRSHRNFYRKANAERVRAIGQSLTSAAEALLAAGEVTTLRRMVSDWAISHDLDTCRIVLPDGQTIADAVPRDITLPKVPKSWAGGSGVYEEAISGGKLTLGLPFEVIGRGPARLEISASVSRTLRAELAAQAGLGVIVATALAALLVIHRRSRRGLRAIGAVQDALMAMAGGNKSPEALKVSPDLGPEAAAWNEILAEKEDLKNRVILEQARESLQSSTAAGSDLSTVCDALTQGLILVDGNNRAKYANGAAAVLLQTRRDDLLGADISGLIKDERVLAAIRSAATGPTHERSIFEVERDGQGAEVLRYVIRPARREDSGVAMVIIEDITQKRVAEKARDLFLAQATHELRTPLSNIRLYVETAIEEGDRNPATRAKCLNVINEESRRLERIVSDILSVSEIEAGSFKIKKDDVRFETLLEQLAADYEPQAKEKQITLTFDLPPKLPVLQGDRDKITLALHNLIGNALKYTPPGGRVTVSASSDHGQFALEVADTGIGINDQDKDKVFEKFYRADNARVAKIPGSGMGLALAREIIRLHGGDITVESQPNRGSTFSLTLPMSEKAA